MTAENCERAGSPEVLVSRFVRVVLRSRNCRSLYESQGSILTRGQNSLPLESSLKRLEEVILFHFFQPPLRFAHVNELTLSYAPATAKGCSVKNALRSGKGDGHPNPKCERRERARLFRSHLHRDLKQQDGALHSFTEISNLRMTFVALRYFMWAEMVSFCSSHFRNGSENDCSFLRVV